MKILLVSQYEDEFNRGTIPNNPLLVEHFIGYHKRIYDILVDSYGKESVIIKNMINLQLTKDLEEIDIVLNIQSDVCFTFGDIYIYQWAEKNNKRIISGTFTSKLFDSDKVAGKLLASRLNIPTPNWYLPSMIDKLDGRKKYIVKPRNSHASIGITNESVIKGKNNIKKYLSNLKKENFFVEEFIEGDLVSMGCIKINNKYLFNVPSRLKPRNNDKVITFESKRTTGSISSPLKNKKLLARIKKYTKKYYCALQPCQICRIDYMIDKYDNVYFIEANITCNLSEESNFISQITKKYFNNSYKDFINGLLNIQPNE